MKANLIIFIISFFAFQAFAQTNSEEQKIAETINLYFDGMIERNRTKLDQAFDPAAQLIGYRGKNFMVTTYEDWASGTVKGEPRNPTLFTNKILEIERKGYTAIAKTELFWPGIYYFDYLTLINIDGKWKIVHKTWYEEKREN